MAYIQLKWETAERYRSFLYTYRQITGKEPGPIERTEAFICASSKNLFERPYWCM